MDIKNIRKQTGLSQKKFAEKIGVPVRTLQGWEQGYRNPPDYIMNMINSVLSRNDLVDQYGNNTNFSDFIMSDMTTKGLLGRWADIVYEDVICALKKCYMKTNNMDAYDVNVTDIMFDEAENKIKYLTPVFEDVLNTDISGIEDIFIAIYGVTSDEVYAMRIFLKDNAKRNSSGWDADHMWNDCCYDKRLRVILMGNTASTYVASICKNNIPDDYNDNKDAENVSANNIDIRFHTDFIKQNDLINCKIVFQSYSDIECTKLIDGSRFETTLTDCLGWVHYQIPVIYENDTTYIQLDLMNEYDTIFDTFYFMFKKAYQKHPENPNLFVVEDGWIYELHPRTKIQRQRSFKQILDERTYRTHIIIQTHVNYCE